MKPVFPRKTGKLPTLLIVASIALMAFVAIYPPFLPTPFTEEYKTARLLFEGSILFLLSVYLSKNDAEIFVVLLTVGFLYMMNWFFSAENIENVLSHFNKFAFLLLISSVLRRRNDLALLAKKMWIMFWVYCSIMGVVGYFLMTSNLVSPTVLVGVEEGLGRYYYYNYPFIGNFHLRIIPRYTGFLFEPGMLGFFFGFNMVIAKQLVVDTKKCRLFLGLNMFAGLLTVSYAFFIFLVFFFCLRFRMVARLVSNKLVLMGFIGFFGLIIMAALTSILNNVEDLLPYSSVGDRLLRYVLSIEFLREQSLGALVFGVGLFPFHEAIGRGASAGIIDVLASRGILLLGVWLYVLYMKAKHIPGLFAFILLYSLVFDYWHFPLFMIGLAIAASLDSSKYRGRIVPRLPTNIAYRSPARLGGI